MKRGRDVIGVNHFNLHFLTSYVYTGVQPATVSRCGMIYLEPSSFGWRPIFTSWVAQLPPSLADHSPLITALVDWLVDPCLDLVQRHLKGGYYIIITS